ncbi:MAG: ATP-binding protein [Bacteroidia bacterium]
MILAKDLNSFIKISAYLREYLLQEKFTSGIHNNAKSWFRKIKNIFSRIVILLEELFNFARLINFDKQIELIDLNQTLNDILSDFKFVIENKHAEIRSDRLPVIRAISLQMKELFCHLISNSLKFSKRNVQPVITITSRIIPENELKRYYPLDGPLTYNEIVFKDNGLGFNPKYADEIFVIFKHLRSGKNYYGTGIGLALCKKIVEIHKGLIFAESKENKGASFHIILPL